MTLIGWRERLPYSARPPRSQVPLASPMKRLRPRLAVLLPCLALGLGACLGPREEAAPAPSEGFTERTPAFSLLGRPLLYVPPSDAVQAGREAELAEARALWEADPRDEANIVWYGRRLAYLGRYQEAIEVYSAGLELHPDSPRLLRHRGHRYISLRRFAQARQDLRRAALLAAHLPYEIEPDGQPNEWNIPRTSLQGNIHYHLALAQYLDGDFAGAARDWRRCLEWGRNDDNVVSSSYWLYLSLRRLGLDREAAAAVEPVSEDMDILENHGYQRLCLLFRGDLSLEELMAREESDGIQSATLRYGLASWHLLNGERERAAEMLLQIVSEDSWSAFGHIAAEADLARLGFALLARD